MPRLGPESSNHVQRLQIRNLRFVAASRNEKMGGIYGEEEFRVGLVLQNDPRVHSFLVGSDILEASQRCGMRDPC